VRDLAVAASGDESASSGWQYLCAQRHPPKIDLPGVSCLARLLSIWFAKFSEKYSLKRLLLVHSYGPRWHPGGAVTGIAAVPGYATKAGSRSGVVVLATDAGLSVIWVDDSWTLVRPRTLRVCFACAALA
jgi:hypothetical protein